MIAIESSLFEFLKRKAFLQMGVGIRIDAFQYAPLQDAQESIYSLLLIDLFNIFDEGIEQVFGANNLKDERRKSRFRILRERNFIEDNTAKYLLWYRDWRNNAAHRFKLIQYHELEQATTDIQKQLRAWHLINPVWHMNHYWEKISETPYKIGSRIDRIPILSYDVNYYGDPPTPSHPTKASSIGKTIDLSLEDYLQAESGVIKVYTLRDL